MKTFFAKGLFILAAVCLVMTACDTPISLGSKINTEYPVIKIPDAGSQPGSFLHGVSNEILLDVEQEFGIESVWMYISYTPKGGGNPVEEAKLVKVDPVTGLYKVDLDVSGYEDGTIKTWVIATDVDGKKTRTTDIIYTVKNIPPQIEMTIPGVKGAAYDVPAKHPMLDVGTIFQGNDIMGIATDALGLGFMEGGVLTGYPEIKIWPVEDDVDGWPAGLPTTGPGAVGNTDGFPDNPPWNMWWPLLDDKDVPLNDPSYYNRELKATQFRFPLRKFIMDGTWRPSTGNDLPGPGGRENLPTGLYRFKVRVADQFETTNTYPNRRDNKAGPVGPGGEPTSLPENDPSLNQYMQLRIIASENPVIRWEGAIPAVSYTGFPNFYNGAANLNVYLTITSGNPITTTRVRVTNGESSNFDPLLPDDLVDQQYINPNTYGYLISIPYSRINATAPGSGDKILHVEAVDNLGHTSDTSRPITIDITRPEMIFTEPANLGPSWDAVSGPNVTSTVIFRGSALDNQRVVKMYYALGVTECGAGLYEGDDPNNLTGWTDSGLNDAPRQGHPGNGASTALDRANFDLTSTLSSWGWRFTNIADVCSNTVRQNYYVTRIGTGNLWNLPIKFKLVDVAGNVKIEKIRVTVDPDADLPNVSINSHTNYQTVGGSFRINGIAEDNDWVSDVKMRIYRQPGTTYAPETPPTELVVLPGADGNGWVSVTTPSMKSSAISWYMTVNEDKQLNPPTNDPDRKIRRVRMEFKAIDAYPGGTPDKDRLDTEARITSIYLDFDNTVPVIDTARMVNAGPANYATQAALDTALDGPNGYNYDPNNGTLVSGFVTMRVKARDESGLVNIRLRSGALNEDLLTVANLTRAKNNVNPWVIHPTELTAGGITVAGTKYRIMYSNEEGTGSTSTNYGRFQTLLPVGDRVSDLEATFIASTGVTLQNGEHLMQANASPLTVAGTDFMDFEYTIYIPLSTNSPTGTTQFGSGHENAAESFAMDLQVLDNTSPAPFITQSGYTLKVDNQYPLGDFSGSLNVIAPSYTIAGRAWDNAASATVQEIKEVVVYFSKPGAANSGYGTPLTLKGASSGGSWIIDNPLGQRGQSVRINRTSVSGDPLTIASEGTQDYLPFFPNDFANGSATRTGIRINSSGAAGYASASIGSPPLHNWYVADFDFKDFGDGELTVNYVVFDHVGNATYYAQNIFLANNRPIINAVNLGTSLDGTNDVFARKVVTYDPLDGNMRVRNNRFSMKLEVTGPKSTANPSGGPTNLGAITYDVAYVTRITSGTPAPYLASDFNTAGLIPVPGTDPVEYYAGGTIIPASKMIKDNVYTIAHRGKASGSDSVNWLSYGVLVDLTNPDRPSEPIDPVGITFVATKNGVPRDDTNPGVHMPGTTTYGDPKNDGWVYAYSVPGGAVTNNPERKRNQWIDADTTITFANTGGTDGGVSFGPIPDSDKTLKPDGVNFELKNDRFFIVKVTDSIGISNAVLVKVDVHNTDTTPPVMDIAHFGKKVVITRSPDLGDYTDRDITDVAADGSEYNLNIVTTGAGVKKGYVQYRQHSAGGTVADLSGMVIFRGKAADNNRVQSISVNIGGTVSTGGTTADGIITTTDATITGGTTIPIATWDGTEWVIPATAGNTMAAMKLDTTNTWGFNAEKPEQKNTLDFGHVINWEFGWDTSSYTSVVGNTKIHFTVSDRAGAGARTTTKTFDVNIVPYITEVVTLLSKAMSATPSAFNRSANGWYPVKENDVIQIKGFNFTTDTNTTVHLGNTGTGNSLTLEPGGGTTVYPARSKTLINAEIGTTYNSAALRVRVNGIEAINNTNSKTAHYNQEPNNLNNNTLNDDRYLYVWRVGAFYTAGVTGAISTSTTGRDFPYLNPVMRMDTRSNWYISFGGAATNPGNLFVAKNGTTNSVTNNSNRWRHTTVAYDARGNIYTIGADQTYNSVVWRFGARVNAGDTAYNGTWRTTVTSLANAGGDRFQLPRIAAQSTKADNTPDATDPTRILLSYFDTMADQTTPNQLRLHYGLVTGAGSGNDANSGVALNAAQIVANNDSAYPGSMFTAVGFLSTGRPVIAWYDRVNMNLVLSYGNVPTNNATVPTALGATGTDSWQTRAKIVHSLAGSHVDMVIDEGNDIHLAYYDSLNGGLYYALVPSDGAGTTPNVIKDTQYVKVDTYLSAGTRIMLNVRKETHTAAHPSGAATTRYVPYISYFHGSFDETRNSVRVAWRNDFLSLQPGSDENDRLTGAWEVMTVPVQNVPASGMYICNGVPTSGTISNAATTGFNGNAAAGSTTGIQKSILVGYMTDINYEGAVLKYDIIK